MGSVCSIGLVALLPRGGRSRKRDAGRGAEVKPPVRGRPTRVTGQGSRECHAIMAIERVFRARHASAPPPGDGTEERRPQRSKTDRTGVSRMCVTRCRRGLPIKNLKGLRHTQTTWGRPGANEAPGATDRYVRANCTYHLSHLSTAALYTGGSAADASLHNTYPRGFTRPRAHGPCHCRLMGCEPHLPPRKDPGRHTLQTHSDRGGCGTPMQGRLKCRGIL